jgi:TetR/AcrR family transcriptional regulator, cholesterol catabolism regulator
MRKPDGALLKAQTAQVVRHPAGRRAKPAGGRKNIELPGGARQILDAAAWLLRHRGYEATTTRAIAERVGIKAGSIYHHFSSKDAIVERVINEGVRLVYEAVTAALDALPAKADPRSRLQAAVTAHLRSSLEHSDYTSASIRAFAFLPAELRKTCRLERHRYEDIWRDIVVGAARAGYIPEGVNLDAARLMLLGAVNWAGEWYRPNRVPIDQISASFAELTFGPDRGSKPKSTRAPASKGHVSSRRNLRG